MRHSGYWDERIGVAQQRRGQRRAVRHRIGNATDRFHCQRLLAARSANRLENVGPAPPFGAKPFSRLVAAPASRRFARRRSILPSAVMIAAKPRRIPGLAATGPVENGDIALRIAALQR
jgi:hypothetical protein